MRTFLLAAALGLVGLGFVGTNTASAHEPGFGRVNRYYGNNWYGNRFYNNNWNRVQPHWHRTYTPFGVRSWYGLDRHERWNGHPSFGRGYSVSPWGVTEHLYRRPFGYRW